MSRARKDPQRRLRAIRRAKREELLAYTSEPRGLRFSDLGLTKEEVERLADHITKELEQ